MDHFRRRVPKPLASIYKHAAMDVPAALKQYLYRDGPHDDHWEVQCEICRRTWKLYKHLNMNYLGPLEYHALSHKEELPLTDQRGRWISQRQLRALRYAARLARRKPR